MLVYEDSAGFITHHHLMPRNAQDGDVVVEQTRIVQERLGGRIQQGSFDRGFHTPENQKDWLGSSLIFACPSLEPAKQNSSRRRRPCSSGKPGSDTPGSSPRSGRCSRATP